MPEMQAAPQGAPQEGGENPLMTLMETMMALRQGAEGSAPPEALKVLDQSIMSFQQFVEIMGGGGQAQRANPATVDTAGAQARPADM